jgi:hypothetical protein
MGCFTPGNSIKDSFLQASLKQLIPFKYHRKIYGKRLSSHTTELPDILFINSLLPFSIPTLRFAA